jgi:hypothetical protein
MRRGPRFPPRLLLGTLGLTAFVVMHGLTFPGGHLISGANPMVDAGTSVADERMVSTTHRRLPTMFAAPEPPVPRFAIAH